MCQRTDRPARDESLVSVASQADVSFGHRMFALRRRPMRERDRQASVKPRCCAPVGRRIFECEMRRCGSDQLRRTETPGVIISDRWHEPDLPSDCDEHRNVLRADRGGSRGYLHGHQICSLGRMMVPAIFTLDIDGRPVLAFEAKNLSESRELCRELWLRQDIAGLMSNGAPLWDGKAPLRARRSTEG